MTQARRRMFFDHNWHRPEALNTERPPSSRPRASGVPRRLFLSLSPFSEGYFGAEIAKALFCVKCPMWFLGRKRTRVRASALSPRLSSCLFQSCLPYAKYASWGASFSPSETSPWRQSLHEWHISKRTASAPALRDTIISSDSGIPRIISLGGLARERQKSAAIVSNSDLNCFHCQQRRAKRKF